MSNVETKTPKSLNDIRANLTDAELKRIKKMVLGYGNFKATADKAGLHVETLRGVITRGGYGDTRVIEKIKAVITEAA